MESEYEIKINLSAIKVRGNAEFKDTNLQQNIQNGECFGVSVPDDIEPKLVEFVFDIGIMPLQNNAFNSEKGQQSGKTTRDDDYIFEVPTDHDHENAMRSSRTVPITVYEAHKLNGKPIVINLGKIDPHGQFLNRRLFVETKNDLGRNYHALLYAIATKNGETEENKVFVGFAQLVRANGETSTSEQRQVN
ncbi:hypothetical protein niasHT_001340 [Heterodera trifolii]|uniref:Uncharacterized protein n=1 Tax=Heterodera trifolii TaxID=157864 RepID=A0ABD2LNA7_9BILA